MGTNTCPVEKTIGTQKGFNLAKIALFFREHYPNDKDRLKVTCCEDHERPVLEIGAKTNTYAIRIVHENPTVLLEARRRNRKKNEPWFHATVRLGSIQKTEFFSIQRSPRVMQYYVELTDTKGLLVRIYKDAFLVFSPAAQE